MKRIIQLGAGVAALVLCLCFSVYFEDLDVRRAELESRHFNPEQQLERFWNDDLPRIFEEALDWETFDRLLSDDPERLIEQYGKTLGIGAPYSFVIRGEAVTDESKGETVVLRQTGNTRYAIRTGFIFGNTVREASGRFHIDDFENTMDFNLISSEINEHIVRKIIAPVIPQLKSGTRIGFHGAVDVDPKRLSADEYEIIPLQLEILPHE